MHTSYQGDLPRDMIHQTTFPDWESVVVRVGDEHVALDVTGDWLTQEDTIPVHGDGTLTIYGGQRRCELRSESREWQAVEWQQANTLVVVYRIDVHADHTRLEGRNAGQQALRLIIEPGTLHWANTPLDENGA